MKPVIFRFVVVMLWALVVSSCLGIEPPTLFQPGGDVEAMSRVDRVRVVKQSPDGAEVQLSIEYTYDGADGATAVLLPVIKKKGEKGVSAWFGCDPVTVAKGHGLVTIKVKYFNDEQGVPPQVTTDSIEILLLNNTKVALLSRTKALKTIHWGNASAPAVKLPAKTEVADAKAEALAAEARARDEARRAADAEAKARADAAERDRVVAERKAEDQQKAREQEEAAKIARAKAEAETVARQKAEEEVKRREAARIAAATAQAEEERQSQTFAVDPALKTRITNVDVVNRSLDRSQMTIGVEFEYKDSLQSPTIGVDVYQTSRPQTRSYFEAKPAELAKSRRSFVLVPVKFTPPKPEDAAYDAFGTDQVLVYMQEGGQGRHNVLPAAMPLTWHSPLARPTEEKGPEDSVQIDNVKQDDLFSGYVGVKYVVAAASAKLRLLLFDSGDLKSIEWFATPELTLEKGPGVQLAKFVVRRDANTANSILKTDMVQVDLLDASGKVLASASKQAAFSWAKPK